VRYVVLGCGAVGGSVAAGLARDGKDVLVSDVDPAVVAAVSEHGLRVEGAPDSFTVRLPAVSTAELPPELNCPVLVAVRAHDTAAAARLLAGRLHGDGYAVSLGPNPDVLVSALGAGQVVAGFRDCRADLPGPGVVRPGPAGTFVLGELDGSVTGRVRSLAAALGGAEVTSGILGYVWAGLACEAVLAAAAVSGLPAAGVLADPAQAPLLLGLARQVLAQAPARPAAFGGFEPADLPASLRWLARTAASEPGGEAAGERAALRRLSEAPAMLGGMNAPLPRRVAELARAIGEGSRPRSPGNLALLAAHERLERLGRPLNAVVTAIGAPARAAGGALAGRLVAVKDIIEVAGVPTRCGSPASDPAPASRDAALVSSLRAAGAEVFATTQCLEYAAGFAHPRIGDTRNPRDPSRTSGGSSGGSAALVAAGVCDLALGTDTGGSVRIPAAYCGVVGLKPSYGLLPAAGIFPLSPSCDHAGTLTATAGGAAELLAVLAPAADGGTGGQAADPAPPSLGVLTSQLTDPSVTAEVRAAVSGALASLAAAGWQLRELDPPWLSGLGRWDDALAAIVASEAWQVHRDRDTTGYAAGTRALLEFGASVSRERYARALAEQAELTAAVDGSLAGLNALAGPTVGFQAPEQDPPFGVGEDSGEGRFTGPYNLTGHPAVSIPVPAAGLPAGLQLAGRRGADLALLRVAAAAERVFGQQARAADPGLAREE
jgi:Asp-tRNA(Asn)/Glu-tRNA(Gln) amidotransferase A subunit family amidase/ketopantoate reductase